MVNDVDGPATDQRHVAVITIFSAVTLAVKNDRYRLVAKLRAQTKKRWVCHWFAIIWPSSATCNKVHPLRSLLKPKYGAYLTSFRTLRDQCLLLTADNVLKSKYSPDLLFSCAMRLRMWWLCCGISWTDPAHHGTRPPRPGRPVFLIISCSDGKRKRGCCRLGVWWIAKIVTNDLGLQSCKWAGRYH